MSNENFKISGEWYFEYFNIDTGEANTVGPITNHITVAGLAKIAELIEGLTAVYLVLGDDTAAGDTINETYRQVVSVVSRSSNIVRFRTQIPANSGNGSYEKASTFYEGTATAGTGTMLNVVLTSFTKASNTILTIETRITVSDA